MGFLEERVLGLELQLKGSHEEAALLKQEARKTSSALWKKVPNPRLFKLISLLSPLVLKT